jgi:hypothetical protein
MIEFFKKIFNIENKNSSLYDLVGKTALAETQISSSFGVASIIDDGKKITCRSYDEVICKGERVLITEFNENDEIYLVDYYPR